MFSCSAKCSPPRRARPTMRGDGSAPGLPRTRTRSGAGAGALPRRGRPAARHPRHPRARCARRSRCSRARGCWTRAAGAGSRPRGWRRPTRARWSPGLDRNVELLRDAPRGPTWLEGDLHDPGLPARSFDVVRTERVLMYVPDLHRALDALLRLLAPGGRLVLFELDYGATILAPSRLGDRVVRRAGDAAGRLAAAAARRPPAPAAAGRARRPRRRRAAATRSRSTSRSGGGSSTPRWRRSPIPSCWPTSTSAARRRCRPRSPGS